MSNPFEAPSDHCRAWLRPVLEHVLAWMCILCVVAYHWWPVVEAVWERQARVEQRRAELDEMEQRLDRILEEARELDRLHQQRLEQLSEEL